MSKKSKYSGRSRTGMGCIMEIKQRLEKKAHPALILAAQGQQKLSEQSKSVLNSDQKSPKLEIPSNSAWQLSDWKLVAQQPDALVDAQTRGGRVNQTAQLWDHKLKIAQ